MLYSGPAKLKRSKGTSDWQPTTTQVIGATGALATCIPDQPKRFSSSMNKCSNAERVAAWVPNIHGSLETSGEQESAERASAATALLMSIPGIPQWRCVGSQSHARSPTTTPRDASHADTRGGTFTHAATGANYGLVVNMDKDLKSTFTMPKPDCGLEHNAFIALSADARVRTAIRHHYPAVAQATRAWVQFPELKAAAKR
jgi:hypothetical protein